LLFDRRTRQMIVKRLAVKRNPLLTVRPLSMCAIEIFADAFLQMHPTLHAFSAQGGMLLRCKVKEAPKAVDSEAVQPSEQANSQFANDVRWLRQVRSCLQ